MPYIGKKDRKRLDKKIAKVVKKLKKFDPEELEGALNYTLTTIINDAMKPKDGWRYKWINRAVGVLDCLKFEFYRRLAAPYEDKAVARNGDLPCYAPPPETGSYGAKTQPFLGDKEVLEWAKQRQNDGFPVQEIVRPEITNSRTNGEKQKMFWTESELKDDQKSYRKEEEK